MPPSAPSIFNASGKSDLVHFEAGTTTGTSTSDGEPPKENPIPPGAQLYQGLPYGNIMTTNGQGYSGGGGLYSSPFSMGAYGTNNSPYYGGANMYGGYGAFGGGMATTGPISNLNQFLFGVQNLIFSLTQAVQIIGMNTEAVQKLLESGVAMFDHAMATWYEMKALEDASRALESDDDRKRRRRLRALRWALTAAATYTVYSLLRYVMSRRRSNRHLRIH